MQRTITFDHNFFRHYKNKDYHYIDEVLHSETMEPLALYKTLYDNDRSSLWVRPKDMFFEKLIVNGEEKQRFEKVNLTLRESTSIESIDLKQLCSLCTEIFDSFDIEKFKQKLSSQQNILILEIFDGDRLLAFKIGYAWNNKTFYSWLGGVANNGRRLGLATTLMNHQHQWCKSQGFKKVTTKSMNKWKAMLALNIKSGFDIVGIQANSRGTTKILLEKTLT